MGIQIKSTEEVKHDGGVKVGIHSAAGMGKTMLTATCKKPIIILTERGGVESLTESNIKKVFGKKAVTTVIPVIEAYTTEDFTKALDFCLDDDRFDTVCINSISELSKIALKECAPNFKNKLQAYGYMADQMDDFIRSLNSSDKNIIMEFHSVPVDSYDEEGDPVGTVFFPGFEGQKMRLDFPFLNGNIFCLVNEMDDEGEYHRKLRTSQGDSKHYAKNRSGILNELEEPHIQNIFNKLNKK